MRLLLLCLTFFFIQLGLSAQPFVQQLVSIDYENNGALEHIATIPNSLWPEREYTFDPISNNYYFTAQSTSINNLSLFGVDLDSGVSTELDVTSFNNAQGQPTFEFHPTEELVYTIIAPEAIDLPVRFASLSLADGSYTVIETIPGILDWNSLHSTLNPTTNTYYLTSFAGKKILAINTNNGAVITETNFASNTSLRHIDFNVEQNKMVGLVKIDPDALISLVDIDPITLEFSNPRMIDGLKNTISNLTQGAGTITYDSENELYHVIGFDTQNELKLFTIDANTAEVLFLNDYQNPPLDPYFMERHAPEKLMYDSNSDRLLALIRLELLPSSYSLISRGDVKMFPNPISTALNMSWKEESPEQIQIFDLSGRERLSVTISEQQGSIQLDLSSLSASNYYVIFRFKEDRYWYQQFSKL